MDSTSKKFYESKKWLAAIIQPIAAIIVPIVNKKFELGLTEDNMSVFLGSMAAIILYYISKQAGLDKK